MNLLIFTSKVRRDLSKKTNLTNLSKTTIMEGNLTNKSSIVSAASIAKIFNDIEPINKINIGENKYNNRNESNKNDKSSNNNNNIVNKNKNLLSIQIKRNLNLKEKIHLNKKLTNLNIENNFRNSYNSYNLNNFNNNSNTYSNNFNCNNNTDISAKYNKLYIKKKKTKVIKIKTE